MPADTVLLAMAYGSPGSEAEVAPYYTHIRRGRPPTPEQLADLVARYQAIGFSPLNQITAAQASGLGSRIGLPAIVGMKHAAPFIADAVAEAARMGARRLLALPLAPHFARMSVGGYERAIRDAGWEGDLVFIGGFSDHPAFTSAVAGRLAGALRDFPADHVYFTAHSLPERIRAEGDDYPGRLLQSARLVADLLSLPAGRWSIAFQSASTTGEPWFGPDILEAIASAPAGHRLLVCPIGFVADHLEILYDLDLEAAELAAKRGVGFRRTPMFNADADFIDALEAIVAERLTAAAAG